MLLVPVSVSCGMVSQSFVQIPWLLQARATKHWWHQCLSVCSSNTILAYLLPRLPEPLLPGTLLHRRPKPCSTGCRRAVTTLSNLLGDRLVCTQLHHTQADKLAASAGTKTPMVNSNITKLSTC